MLKKKDGTFSKLKVSAVILWIVCSAGLFIMNTVMNVFAPRHTRDYQVLFVVSTLPVSVPIFSHLIVAFACLWTAACNVCDCELRFSEMWPFPKPENKKAFFFLFISSVQALAGVAMLVMFLLTYPCSDLCVLGKPNPFFICVSTPL